MQTSHLKDHDSQTCNIEDFFVLSDSKRSRSFFLNFDYASFKYSRALLLCALTCLCTGISVMLNLVEGDSVFPYPLMVTSLISLIGFLYLLIYHKNETVVSVIIWIMLLTLGIFIILYDPSKNHRSLLWISVFPPVCVLTLGLRYAYILFGLFILTCIIIFVSPLNALATVPIDQGTQIRFIISMIGGFLLVSCLEYARMKTFDALQSAVRHISKTSLTDILTGLGNRRYCDRFLAWVMANCKRGDHTYGVIMLDIDHFKRVNDTYGHEVGDYVLQHLATEVKKKLRGSDILFRWGGEEFIVIMPSCTESEAKIVGERIRVHLQRSPFCLSEEKIYITVSLGIYIGNEAQDSKIPISIADQCLYTAKSGGRNNVVICQ